MFKRRIVFSFLFSASLFAAPPNLARTFFEAKQLTQADAARLESALASDPDDVEKRAQLLGFYSGAPGSDSGFSNRMRLLTWAIEHHPDTELLSFPGLWSGMPDAMFQQLKPQWIAQVHQHADDPNVLRSAAAFLNSKNAPTMPTAIRVGGNVAAANLFSQVQPAYPALARQARIQGTVKFNATIGVDGHVKDLTLVGGHPLLVAAAKDAAEQWVYKPTLLNGNPVQIMTNIDVDFKLEQ